jgi:aryl-alcohol dehydrogenase-like predicted oxidoreductase
MGCMAFSHGYGQIPPEQYSIEAIRGAYEHGCTFFDTAEVYSPGLSGIGHNERIVGKALHDVRDNVVLATKLFLGRGDFGGGSVYDELRAHLEASMRRLQTDHVELYYLHRMGGTPIERVAEAMGQLVEEGYIDGWGLSQVDVDIIDRAQQVYPLTAIQNIYSMVERDVEAEVLPYCEAHDTGFVPFSPIASGLLSSKVTTKTKFEKFDDVRTWVPQLSKRNIQGNQPIVDLVTRYAEAKGATPAQISLAWMLTKWPHVVPIPGSKNKGRIIENLDASKVELYAEELTALDTELGKLKVYGHRGFSR